MINYFAAQSSGTVSPQDGSAENTTEVARPVWNHPVTTAVKSVKYSPSELCEYNHSLNPTSEDGVECGKDGTYREDLEIVLCDRHYKEMK